MCIDYEANQLYWADARVDRLEVVDLEGGGRRLLSSALKHPFSLALVSICIHETL